MDSDPLNNFVCSDIDADGCDDCSSGTFDILNDGTDTDSDGICDSGDNCIAIANANQTDEDLDGYGAVCDCDDFDSLINPSSTDTAGSGIDANCDGMFAWYADVDNDTYGSHTIVLTTSAAPSIGESDNNLDCNDSDAEQYPGQTWYKDADGDGFGNPAVSLVQCTRPSGYVIDNNDTDDTNEYINPNNAAPIANAGIDQTVVVNNTVQLNGSGSSDPDFNELDYYWTIVSAPSGSVAYLSDVFSVNPYFIPDLAGNYEIGLVVNDGWVESPLDQVTIVSQTLQGAIQDINGDISDLVNSGILTGSDGEKLSKKLDDVTDKLDDGKDNSALGKLNSFINKVNSMIKSGDYTPQEAAALQALIASTTRIIDNINSSTSGKKVKSKSGVAVELETRDNPLVLYPNPFAVSVKLEYLAASDANMSLTIYSINGIKMATVFEGNVEQSKSYNWMYEPGPEVSSGLYLLHIVVGESKKVMPLMYFPR